MSWPSLLSGLAGNDYQLGGLTPTFGNLEVGDAAELLQGLAGANRNQLRRHIPGINSALIRGLVRYERSDQNERWQTIEDLRRTRKGDCEDLAAAVAAELDYKGIKARPVIYRVRPGLAHAVVQLLDARHYGRHRIGEKLYGHPVIKIIDGTPIIDPSRTGGMGRA